MLPSVGYCNRDGDKLRINLRGKVGHHDGSNIHPTAIEALLARHRDISRITVSIDSPGGWLKDGIAIHDMLRDHKACVQTIAGAECSSAASVILMAGSFRQAHQHSNIVLHLGVRDVVDDGKRWTADRHRRVATALDKSDRTMIDIYKRAGVGVSSELLKAELANDQALPIGIARAGASCIA
jgi:ATP-dependent protease ClpP protease subunit